MGYYFMGNTGDDLLQEAIARTLGRHGEVKAGSVEVFERGLIDWCELLVIGAGSLITPRGIGGYDHAKYARERGKKIFYYAQTIEAGHPLFTEHLARADLITVRDEMSRRAVAESGFRAVLTADPLLVRKQRTIGCAFRSWVNEPPDLAERLAAVLDDLAADYDIVMMPFTECATDTPGDDVFHGRVMDAMKRKPNKASYAQFITAVDLLLAMRLHALIGAVNTGKPVVAIDYDAKIGRIFADLAMSDRVVSYDEIEAIPSLVRDKVFPADRLARREKINEALVAGICADIRGEPRPAVSVVMPTYNRERYLPEAIASICNQTLAEWELIIIDDGSTDDTAALVASYRDERIRYYNFGHNGISFSRNIGSLLSRGEIIVVADSDDINLPQRLETTRDRLKESGAGLFYASMYHSFPDGRRELILSHPFSHERLRGGNFIYHPTVAYRRELARQCPYDEGLEMVEDYHMYLRAAGKGYAFYREEQPLVIHRLHEKQISMLRAGEMAAIHDRLVKEEAGKSHDEGYGRQPLVSVIVPTFNRPNMLRKAIESIMAQSYSNFEIIVVNDAGVDVKPVIDALNRDDKIIYLRHDVNRGLSTARNTALRAAKGEYIAYLDDDDIHYPHHLEVLVGRLENSPAYGAAYTDSVHVTEAMIDGKYETVGKKVIYSRDFDRNELLVSNYIPVINVMHRKSLLAETGFFDKDLDAHEDWEMWVRMSQKFNFVHIPEVTAQVSVRSDGTTMTSADRAPFLSTMKSIHSRYAHLAEDPRVESLKKTAEDLLAEDIEIGRHATMKPCYEANHRFRFVGEYVKGKRALVVGIGDGYGGLILAESADRVVCIDADGSAVRRASARYARSNIRYMAGNLHDFAGGPSSTEKFDTVVLADFQENHDLDDYMRGAKRLLGQGGLLFIFIPKREDAPAAPEKAAGNRSFSAEIETCLSRHFQRAFLYGQNVYATAAIFPLSESSGPKTTYTVRYGEDKFIPVSPTDQSADFLICMATDSDITADSILGDSTFVDFSDTLARLKDKAIKRLENNLEETSVRAVFADTEWKKLQRDHEEKLSELRSLEADFLQAQTELGQAHAELGQSQTELGQAQTELGQVQTELEQVQTELEQARAVLDDIRHSTSWRITSPIRTVRRFLNMAVVIPGAIRSAIRTNGMRWLFFRIWDHIYRGRGEKKGFVSRLVSFADFHGGAAGQVQDANEAVVMLSAGSSAALPALPADAEKIVVISHDAHFAGAQLLALNIVRLLREKLSFEVTILLAGHGELQAEFVKYGRLFRVSRDPIRQEQIQSLAAQLRHEGYQTAICNTVVTGRIAMSMKKAGMRTISLVHELSHTIEELGLETSARLLAAHSDALVFPARVVQEAFGAYWPVDMHNQHVLPQGVYKNNPYKNDRQLARRLLRAKYGLMHDHVVILGAGYGDRRKGIDLFVEAALMSVQEKRNMTFIWIGDVDPHLLQPIESRLTEALNPKVVRFAGLQRDESDYGLYIAGADVFLMTSREDPFPSVVLDAMDVGLPVIGFEGAGGFSEMLAQGNGLIVPYLNVGEMYLALVRLLDDQESYSAIREQARRTAETDFDFMAYVTRLLRLSERTPSFNNDTAPIDTAKARGN